MSNSENPWTVATRIPCLWDVSGKNTGMACHFLLQGIFPVQGLNLHLLHWQGDSLPLSQQASSLENRKNALNKKKEKNIMMVYSKDTQSPKRPPNDQVEQFYFEESSFGL